MNKICRKFWSTVILNDQVPKINVKLYILHVKLIQVIMIIKAIPYSIIGV